jgi:hypothetical protein
VQAYIANIGKIVPDESSSLDHPLQRARMIDADHMDMCKFESRRDQGYSWVRGDVIELIERAERKTEEEHG